MLSLRVAGRDLARELLDVAVGQVDAGLLETLLEHVVDALGLRRGDVVAGLHDDPRDLLDVAGVVLRHRREILLLCGAERVLLLRLADGHRVAAAVLTLVPAVSLAAVGRPVLARLRLPARRAGAARGRIRRAVVDDADADGLMARLAARRAALRLVG